MKKVFRGFAAFLMMVSIAFATSAKTLDLSKYASGEGWQQFSSALVADKMMVPGSDRFKTVGLSNVMYNALSPEQQASISRGAFDSLNRVVNDLDEDILVKDMPTVSKNLKLPEIQLVAKATTAPPTTLAPAASAPQVQTPAAPVVTAENVQQKLNELSKSIDGKYDGINRRVGELQTALGKAALKSDIAKIVEETQTIVELTSRVKVVEGKVEKLETSVGKLEVQQTAFESSLGRLDVQQRETAADVSDLQAGQSSIGALWNWVYGLAAALTLLTIVVVIAMSRRGGAVKTAAPLRSVPVGDSGFDYREPTLKVV